uniref:Uncharacterized protein n=1 Tax=Plectus sambesii TaxID=2011161 RepID=A0A914WFU3_9BILA
MQLSAWALALLVVVVVTHIDVVESRRSRSGRGKGLGKEILKFILELLGLEYADALDYEESSRMFRRAIAVRENESSMKQQLFKATIPTVTTPTTIATSAKTTTATTKSSPKPRSNNDGISVLAIIGM